MKAAAAGIVGSSSVLRYTPKRAKNRRGASLWSELEPTEGFNRQTSYKGWAK